MLVDKLRGKAVARVLLGGLDVLVDKLLGLEPLTTALIRAGEGTQTTVIHLVKFESTVAGICCQTSSVGAGELRRPGSVLRIDVTFQLPNSCKGCPTILAQVRSQSEVDCISVPGQISLVRESQPACRALERLLLEVDYALVSLQV